MGKIDAYVDALETLGDGRYHYWDGRPNGIGCSEYTRQGLIKADIINENETFHAASGNIGVLGDQSRFQRIPWSPDNLQRGDIMWSHGHHVATWDGKNGVYEAAPENSHGICDNGKTGVGHWSSHTYYNCGTGTYTWTCLYRIIEKYSIKQDIKELVMDKKYNIETIIQFLPTIKRGSRGDFVKALQVILNKYGWYADAIDGIAGPNTDKGIRFLQTALNLPVNGIIDTQAWEAILA